MTLGLESVLEWAYIIVCFVVIWYVVATLLAIWQAIVDRNERKELLPTVVKLILAGAAAKLIVWLGVQNS